MMAVSALMQTTILLPLDPMYVFNNDNQNISHNVMKFNHQVASSFGIFLPINTHTVK